jgi:starch phosphorylase
VQVCYGLLDNQGAIASPSVLPLEPAGAADGMVVFEGRVPCRSSGQYGYTVRVLPKHANLANPFEPGLVAWG